MTPHAEQYLKEYREEQQRKEEERKQNQPNFLYKYVKEKYKQIPAEVAAVKGLTIKK